MLPGAFASLPAEVQAQLTAAGRSGRWGRGGLIFHPDDPAETLHLLTRGTVRLYRLGSGAREVTLDVHVPGALLGAPALLPGSGQSATYGMYAEAMDEVETLQLGQGALHRLFGQQPAALLALTEQLTRQTRGVQERLSGLVFLEVSQRLALALLALAEREGGWDGPALALRDRISHQDLAHAVGSTRETITKLLGDFRARGLLDLGYRRIVLTDRAGLEQAARQPLGPLDS
ncbi:Crp/Fnr family transcriptional regulator [Deinococcus wulumuqiensis]|uniref:Crp/Fnr family transcriptional regulator n=1 Tax=Deinococcus wulumuqiensis TaxID=980427 RepID=A0AAV4K252_9DEIO|nr:Crp/Fnr family transcriptional regulator [Deinococcus wulumuqiensis]QII20477.1 Crp/Fnr family transcriptional regulator [Deinococcus wulumuqiensis R12]GGI77914.1 Crp/Fnr family transcriptional regulator [Deinococcus wulumuqiensis]GGP28888.1 Crp/Fnr family transcriptional regulator [Deinococcus wulumuqiensis]